MSMLCSLYRITPGQAMALRASPDAVGELLGFAPPAPPKVGLLSRLFGKSPPSAPVAKTFEPVAERDRFELDQAWHILHFLLSGSGTEGPGPAAFLISGGDDIGPDRGYGPARLVGPELSRQIAGLLHAQSFEGFDAAYVASKIETADIYWQAASEPAERQRQVDELWRVAADLRAFFADTAQVGHATLVCIY